MSRKFQVIRHSEVIVYTALSFILGAVFMSLLRQLTGWTDTEWSRISQICVYAGLVALWASFFCKVYDTVEGMLQTIYDKRYNRRKRSVNSKPTGNLCNEKYQSVFSLMNEMRKQSVYGSRVQ